MAKPNDAAPITGQPQGSKDDVTAQDLLGQGQDIADEGQGQGAGAAAAPVMDAGAPAVSPKLRELMERRGLKSLDELVDLTADLERTTTKLGQEKRILEMTASLPVYPPPSQAGAAAQPPPAKKVIFDGDPYELVTDKEKFNTFLSDFQAQTREETRRTIADEQGRQVYQSLSNEARNLIAEDPDKFSRLRPRMMGLAALPQNQGVSLHELMSQAEKEELSDSKKRSSEVLRQLSEVIDLDKLKALAPKMRVSISGGSGQGAAAAGREPTTTQEAEQVIKKAILGSNVLAE